MRLNLKCSNSASSPLKDLHNSSVKELQRCNDLLDINALSLPIQGYRGFFPIFSFLSHSCNNNCRHVVKNEGDTYEVRLYSQRGIRRGEELTITYTNLLRPTYRRRAHLSNVWKFVCNCSRCADPSENGSYINAVKCPFCREGHLLPQKSSNYEVWYCTQCDKTVNQSDVEKMVDQLEGVLNDTPKDWVSIKDYLQSMKAYLHSHHYLQILAKRYLTQLLPLEDDFLRQRMSLVEELLHIFDILDSGKSASRGCTLYERGRTQLASGLIPEGISSLKEAKACLEVEDENQSPQGRIKRNIQEILKQI
nr:SET domain-containing protein SmydA-8-like isoform X2 [Lepeophtheirus salmonis]